MTVRVDSSSSVDILFPRKEPERSMAEILTYIAAVVIVVAVCILAMSVGLIFRNRGFTSCGCASITFRGEKIRCPGCPEKDDDIDDPLKTGSGKSPVGRSG